MLRARFLATLGGAVALAATFAPGFARAEVPIDQVPASLAEAIQEHIESQGKEYAGFCREVNERPDVPIGEYCSFVLSIEHDIAEVSYGPVATNDITLVSFKHYAGLWTLIDGQEIPEDPTPAPAPSIPPALDSSIKHYIESFGHKYAGLCEVVNSSPSIPYGEYCAAVKIENDIAEVYWGPIASDALTLVRFKNTGGAWAPIDPNGPTPTPSPAIPAGLNDAIDQYIKSLGKEYAGLCVDVNQLPDLPFGEYCAAITLNGDKATVHYGPVASDDIGSVEFALVNGQWKVAGAEDPTPAPSPTKPAPVVPPALEQAIKQLIESKGKKYAGLCVEVNNRPQIPAGEYCAFVNSIANGVANVSYGPVASDEITQTQFKLEGAQWKPAASASPTQPQAPATPRPPSTGTGTDSESGVDFVTIAGILGAVLLISGTGALSLRRR